MIMSCISTGRVDHWEEGDDDICGRIDVAGAAGHDE